jgi:adenosylcobinamide amidohydrolase
MAEHQTIPEPEQEKALVDAVRVATEALTEAMQDAEDAGLSVELDTVGDTVKASITREPAVDDA